MPQWIPPSVLRLRRVQSPSTSACAREGHTRRVLEALGVTVYRTLRTDDCTDVTVQFPSGWSKSGSPDISLAAKDGVPGSARFTGKSDSSPRGRTSSSKVTLGHP